jgi:tetratricopeptide (TPR) repeat protein
MAGTLWFYVKDDKRLGPVDFEQLVGLLLGGQLPQSALVWHQGLREWMSADRIPEIAEQLPPPLPPGKSPRSTLIIEAPAVVRPRPSAPQPSPDAAPAPVNPRIEELRRRIEKDPNSRVFAQLAEELRKEGDLEEAVRISRDGLQKHPFYPSARMTLGRALLDSGDLEAAKTEFETVLQAAPDNLLARRFLEESRARGAEPEAAAEEDGTADAVLPLPVSTMPPPSLAVADTPVEAATGDEIAPPPGPRAADLPPIPVVAAEEHWELAAPYEVSGRVVAETPFPPAPVEAAAPHAPPAPVPAAAEATPTTPPPVPTGRRRAGANLPDLSTLLADSSVLNTPAADGGEHAPPVEAATPPKPESAAPATDSPAPSETPAHAEVPSTGSLAEYDFPDLLHSLFVRRWTGNIELHRGRVDTSVQVTGGRLVFASSNNRDERLGELLLRREKISLQQYYEASRAIRKGKRLGSILVEQGALEPKDLVKVVVAHTREVIVSVFMWTEGFYQLKEGPDPGTESITLRLSTPDIIMEGIGRIQAWSRIERGVGGPDARYVRADDYQQRLQEMTLTPEKLLLVGDLGGERDVASICSASKLSDYEVCRTLWAFRVIGILRRLDAPATAPPS